MDAEAEALIHWPPDVKNQLTGKGPDAGKDWGQEKKKVAEDEVVRWHHRLNGHEFEWTLGDSEGQRSIMQSMGSQRVRLNLVTQFSSVAQSCPSLQPHRLQHSRPPCPSPTPGVYSNSCPLSRWCHPTISSSVVPFSSCLQSFPASGSFQMSQFFTSSVKYCSFSLSISPSNEYSGLISFRMDWLDLLAVQGTL